MEKENPEFGQLSRYCAITTNPVYVELGRSFAQRVRDALTGDGSAAALQGEALEILLRIPSYDEHLGLLGYALAGNKKKEGFGVCVSERVRHHNLRNGFLPLAAAMHYLPKKEEKITGELRAALRHLCDILGFQPYEDMDEQSEHCDDAAPSVSSAHATR